MAAGLIWEKEGSPCPKCKRPRTWNWGIKDFIVDIGPQGGWECENHHTGWIWPQEIKEEA